MDTVLVRVHDHGIALFVAGDSGPVVVLESGGGASHRAWNTVVRGLARFARVVAHDRPGYGLSAPCDSPRTAERIAHELREALIAAGLGPAWTLVGWSYGGFIVRVFAGNFPADVTGVVLVDPAPEDFYARAARDFPDEWAVEEEAHFAALHADPARRTEQREMAGFSASLEQARASDARHATPTTLLIAGRDSEGEPDPISRMWIDVLRRWGADRPHTEVRIVPGAGHHIARGQPEAVVNAVRERLPVAR